MTRRPVDPTRRLGRVLMASGKAAGCELALVAERAQPWCSATFSGDRHEFTFNATAGTALDAWLEHLPGADLRIPGHLVADVATASATWSGGIATVLINALTVVER